MAIGYIELDDWLPFSKMFAYLDTAEFRRSDEIFQKYRLKVRFKRDWKSPDGRYRMVFCSVRKRQQALFEQAMSDLSKKMILLGYDDYEEVWHKTIKPAEETGVS